MSSDVSSLNPFKRGKSVILSNLILEGKTNKEITDHYLAMGFDKKYGSLNKNHVYSIRSDLKKAGLLNEAGLPVKNQTVALLKSGEPPKTDDTGEAEEPMFLPTDLEKKGDVPTITRRPDWDLLSNDQINRIANPELRMNILNYKTEIDRIKQEIKPEYATRGEIDQLRTDMGTRINEVATTIGDKFSEVMNYLKGRDEADAEEGFPDEAEEEEPETKTPRIAAKANPLVVAETDEAEDDILEVEGNVIAKKHIGFTAKSLMLFDIAKSQGFNGNIADFVNACISDAYKGRSIELAVVDKKVIR